MILEPWPNKSKTNNPCKENWNSKYEDEKDHIHTCNRATGHTSYHRCNCGAYRRASNRLNLGGRKKYA